MEKIKVYSALIGDKDPFEREDNIQCFTEFNKFKRDVYNAKIYKILAHLYIDTDISIWIDGNIKLKVELKIIVKELLGDNEMAIFKHPVRNCIYKEIPEAQNRYKENEIKIRDEIYQHGEYYKKIGYPEHNGLYETGILIRRHIKKIEEFNNAWWAEICKYSNRDQISFPYILSKFPDLKLSVIDGDIRNHKYFRYN